MRRACSQDRSVRGFSWCVRRVNGRSPVHAPPFSAAGRAMGLDRGGVDRQGHTRFAAIGQGFEDRLPAPALGPAIEPIVDCRVRPIFRRAITPARARLKHVHDAANNPPIVVAFRPSQVRRQMWRYLRPLRAIEPEQSLAHPTLPCRIIRHQRITPRYLGTDPNTCQCCHGTIGTVLIAFAGEPLIILVLIAR